jgi:predicted TIM-barrel fold metal-dependent hydrolase
LPIVCLNAYLPETLTIAGRTAETVCFDIAFTEHGNTVDFLSAEINPERLLLGSHTPFLYTESALLKVRHSTRDESVKRRIGGDNARRIFGL